MEERRLYPTSPRTADLDDRTPVDIHDQMQLKYKNILITENHV